MPRKLTDAQVAEIRAEASRGADFDAISERFGVSRRHVSRLVRGDQRETLAAVSGGAVVAAVRELLNGLELDESDRVMAAAAVVLATKLDALAASDSAAAAQAAPGLVRQLSETLREIRGEDHDAAEQLRRMLEPLMRRAA